MPSKRTASNSILLILMIGALAFSGCGSSSKQTTTKHVSTAEVDFAHNSEIIAEGILHCIHAERQSGDSKTIVGGSEEEDREVSQAVRNLISSFRQDPSAIWPSEENPTRSARIYLAEESESLQKFCWPWLGRQIRTVLTYG